MFFGEGSAEVFVADVVDGDAAGEFETVLKGRIDVAAIGVFGGSGGMPGVDLVDLFDDSLVYRECVMCLLRARAGSRRQIPRVKSYLS